MRAVSARELGEASRDFLTRVLPQMVRAQVTNGEPMGTKDVEAQIKFLKEDIDFLLLNPESAGYPPLSSIQCSTVT